MLLQITIFLGYGIVPYKIYYTHDIINLCLPCRRWVVPNALIIFELQDFQETDDNFSLIGIQVVVLTLLLVSSSISSYMD